MSNTNRPATGSDVTVDQALSAATASSPDQAVIDADITAQSAPISERTAAILIGATPKTQAEADLERETELNDGCDRKTILKSANLSLICHDRRIIQAFQTLRRGYPDKSMEEQCRGAEFRKEADLVISEIIHQTVAMLDPKQVVVLMPWRSGLAIGHNYLKHRVNRFFHLSSRRDEETLKTLVDFQNGSLSAQDIVIIADPMLATGNTAVDAINRVMAQGIKPSNIIVNAVVAAPVGIKAVSKFPGLRVVAGAVDEKLDHRGYISGKDPDQKGLGDFGDKYFTDFSENHVHQWADDMKMDKETRAHLIRRFSQHQE